MFSIALFVPLLCWFRELYVNGLLPLVLNIIALLHNNPQEEGERRVDRELAILPNVEFAGLDSNSRAQVVVWQPTPKPSSIQNEGITDKLSPRNVVDRRLIKKGEDFSGVFRIISLFEAPSSAVYTMRGTAFAVDDFHILTSAHMIWHPKLGPARTVTLLLDERENKPPKPFRTCVAVACQADWIKWGKAEHDFCLVAVAKPFDSGVRVLQCHPNPGPSCGKSGEVLGFPFDLPHNDRRGRGRQLVRSEGLVAYRERQGVLKIEHNINTREGNSGGPVIVDGKVVGVHSAYLPDLKKNKAAPVNRNGNNVEHYSAMLYYMSNQLPQLPEGTEDLGEGWNITYPEQRVRLFA